MSLISAVEEKRKRSRSKSPFRKLFSRKRDSEPSEEQEPAVPSTSTVVHEEGALSRKHEWDGHNKKASNRSWDKVYAVVHGSSLSCYKDQSKAKQDPSARIHHESALDLAGAECDYAVDYTKKPYVFRLKLASGSEYLFHAKDQSEMDHWISVLNAAAKGESIASGPSKVQTMPARTEEQKEPKKKGFFTLKKK